MRERLAAMGVFAHVVESRSFSAAAAKLGVSKSLVSREVSALPHRALIDFLVQRFAPAPPWESGWLVVTARVAASVRTALDPHQAGPPTRVREWFFCFCGAGDR